MSPFVIAGSVSIGLLPWGIDDCSLNAIAGFVVAGLFYLKNVNAKSGKFQHLHYSRDSF